MVYGWDKKDDMLQQKIVMSDKRIKTIIIKKEDQRGEFWTLWKRKVRLAVYEKK